MSAASPQVVFSVLLRLEDAVSAFLNGIFALLSKIAQLFARRYEPHFLKTPIKAVKVSTECSA